MLYCTVLYRGEAMFGCVDTWLLYKLTGKHVTEGQCLSAVLFTRA